MSGFFASGSGHSVGSLKKLAVTVVQKGVQVRIAYCDHVSAPTSVTTIRPAFGDELLATETYRAIAAVSGFNPYFCIIYKQMVPLLVCLITDDKAFNAVLTLLTESQEIDAVGQLWVLTSVPSIYSAFLCGIKAW